MWCPGLNPLVKLHTLHISVVPAGVRILLGLCNPPPRSPPASPLTPAGGEPVSACGVGPHSPPIPEVPGAVMYVSPPVGTLDIDEDAYGAPLHFRSLADLMGWVPQHNGIDT
jgi:hypothetical protein